MNQLTILKVQPGKHSIKNTEIVSMLGRQTFSDTFSPLFAPDVLQEYLDRTFNIEKIYNSIQKAENSYLLAYINETPVGYAKLKLNSRSMEILQENQIQLQKIYVLKEFHGRAAGKELLNSCFSIAKEKAFSTMWLVVHHENINSIRFYKSQKFANIGDHFYQIGPHNFKFYLLAKEL